MRKIMICIMAVMTGLTFASAQPGKPKKAKGDKKKVEVVAPGHGTSESRTISAIP